MVPTSSFLISCLIAVLVDVISVVRGSPYYMLDQASSDQAKPWKNPKKCDKKCTYGFESDVEGAIMCKCHDPCSSVMCLGGLQCVVEKPRLCKKEPCKYFAACKDVNVCELPRGDVTDTDCIHKRARWYFDKVTGKCVRYRGCPARGNSFGRKRDCKRKCYKKFRRGRKGGRRNRKYRNQSATSLGAYRGRTLEFNFEKCPENRPLQKCDTNPCDSCKKRHIMCLRNYCGTCSATYYNFRSNRMSPTCS